MIETVLLVSGAIVAFVGITIGGSSTGTVYGPVVGSGVVSMRTAGVLMTLSVLAGGVFAGQRVVETLGTEFIPPAYFTIESSLIVLVLTGLGILFGNLRGIPISTSETIICALMGMGSALGVLNWSAVGQVAIWWVVAPVVAFWLAAVIGRYLYDTIVDQLDLEREPRSTFARGLVLVIACYMGFSAGASNVANAIAPLVGTGTVPLLPALVFGGLAVGAGAFILGPRTTRTIGFEITDFPLEAALIVEFIAATLITLLSLAGVPGSLVLTVVTCTIGLGWGRSTRHLTRLQQFGFTEVSDEDYEVFATNRLDLFNPQTTRKIIATWLVAPVAVGILAFCIFGFMMLVNSV